MEDLINNLFCLNVEEAPLCKVTPKWIDTLGANEIFVFGCRNSGRHWDGASAFALENFGAIMGQREGRQGQSYAIPTIGGVIDLKEIHESVKTFTRYAAEHPELHFLVTPFAVAEAAEHQVRSLRCSGTQLNSPMSVCHESFGIY